MSRTKYTSKRRSNNYWNFAYLVLNTILICSLSSLYISGNTLKGVNPQYGYSKNFYIGWIKQNYCQDCTHNDLNQSVVEKKNVANEIIRIPSLGDNNQWSSIAKKTNDNLYDVKLGWDSTSLKTGKNTIFIISFLNHSTNLEEKQ